MDIRYQTKKIVAYKSSNKANKTKVNSTIW